MEAELVKNGIKAIRYSEQIQYSDDRVFCEHMHDCYHIFCVLTHALELKIGEKGYYCPAGHGLIVPPYTYHKMEEQTNGTPEVIEILFEPEEGRFEETLRKAGVLIEMDEYMIHCFKQVAFFSNSRQTHLRSYAYRFMDAALAELCTKMEDLGPYAMNAQFIDMEGFSDVTKAIVVYIDAHYKEQFTLDDMEKELGYSKGHLCKAFKRETSSTINDYLNLVRITRFAAYYSFSNQEISVICQHCGFASVVHFTRTFKKFLGIPPGRYKQIRFPHFNSDVLVNDLKNTGDIYHKLKGVVERMAAPAARVDVVQFSERQKGRAVDERQG